MAIEYQYTRVLPGRWDSGIKTNLTPTLTLKNLYLYPVNIYLISWIFQQQKMKSYIYTNTSTYVIVCNSVKYIANICKKTDKCP